MNMCAALQPVVQLNPQHIFFRLAVMQLSLKPILWSLFLLLWCIYFWLSHFLQDAFPVRDELLSDLSDDEMQLATVPEPLKPTVISFKQKDDTDLFGLGIQDEAPVAKDSSEEQEGKSRNITCVILTAVLP